MKLQPIKSEGIAHVSYYVSDGGEAAVIDPRRDCDLYADLAHREGCRITHVFETHRNEDYVIGSVPLAELTGATIHHGAALPFEYGQKVADGDTFTIGSLRLKILKTPGHTYESISLALYDTSFGEDAIGVFTGDALFIGDVGRTDFFPDKAEEVAGLLYDSIHTTILPLGDQTILYPAHGAGSVCGSGMADRDFSTLGYEKRHNPKLQMYRAEFIRFKVGEHHYQPPYFRKMEQLNLKGAPAVHGAITPPPMSAREFARAMDAGLQAIDIRSPEAFAGAFVPGSLAIPCTMLPAFAGWFLDYDRPVGLIPPEDGYAAVEDAIMHLGRLGFDNVQGFLAGGVHAWETSGREYGRIPALHAADLQARIDQGDDFTLLDVRSIEEWDEGHLPDATHIYLGHLPGELTKLSKQKPVVTFCGSGRRAIIAASILKQAGYEQVEDALGSMDACKNAGCTILSGQSD